jgi:hypothetical protein
MNVTQGTFDVFISKTYTTPNSDNYDQYYNTDAFTVEFNQDVEVIYVTIVALERLRL